eukprot:TRINITY_DN44856_c0_g1_i1.p1 TRINITY_DN44856_c0_g1~~TRINITY_DN44856_c0_g1_i1.p1  ORF type:complete len:151 (-),score=27.00 TRINITY_DN44856_c0_g1_i1:339-791(-)
MIRRPPRSTLSSSSAASDVYKRQTVDFFIDMHSHSTGLNAFMLCNATDGSSELEFPRLFHKRSRSFSFQRTVTDRDPNKTGSGRRTMHELVNQGGRWFTHCYTLEASFFGYCDYKQSQRPVPFTIQEYQNLGRDTAMTLLDHYRDKEFAP